MTRLAASADGIDIITDGDVTVPIRDADIRPGERNRDQTIKANAFARETQIAIDTIQFVSDLPLDDPDRTIDPARPDLFWRVDDSGTVLVGREWIVSCVWDGDQGLYLPGLRRAR